MNWVLINTRDTTFFIDFNKNRQNNPKLNFGLLRDFSIFEKWNFLTNYNDDFIALKDFR